jgi:hypothetical protein
LTTVNTSAIDSRDGLSIEKEQPSTAFKPMPAYGVDSVVAPQAAHQIPDDFIKLGDIKGEFQVTEFPGDVVTGQANSDDSLAYAGSLFGEGVFKPQSIEDKGSVIFGDNHFRTGGGDSLTGNETSQPTDQPTDGFIKLGDIKGFTSDQNPGAGYCTGHSFETFEPIAGMDSFGESLNPAFEIGGTSGPGGTSFMTGNIGFPTNNIGGSAGPGGDDI